MKFRDPLTTKLFLSTESPRSRRVPTAWSAPLWPGGEICSRPLFGGSGLVVIPIGREDATRKPNTRNGIPIVSLFPCQ